MKFTKLPYQRNTKQRDYILEILKQHKDKHLTSEDIIKISSESNVSIGNATIYRTLLNLQKAGVIRKYSIDNKKGSCYQYIENKVCVEHFHLICSECAKTVHFQDENLMNALKNLGSLKFTLDIPKTVFYGICDDCKNLKRKVLD